MRHNVVALGADLALFLVGLSFASRSTILPAYAEALGAPNVVIGAIPAVMTLGWFLPSLFAAGHTATLPRKLPFVLRYTLWERLPFLVLAWTAFVLADAAPTLALAVLLPVLLLVTGIGGMLLPAWMDIVGRTVPVTVRGRFFAVASVLGNAGGLAGSFAIAYILGAVPGPRGYGVCFLVATVFLGLSYMALARVREPADAVTTPAMPLGAHLSRIPSLLRRDRNLSWFLAARILGVFATMASGFYTVYALRAHDAPRWEVGTFTAVLVSGQIAGSLVFGWLADRVGHRSVIMAGTAATVAANVVALAAPDLATFRAVFVLVGIQLAAVSVSDLPVLLEFAPDAAARPMYLGLGRTSQAPVALAGPLLAGLMAEALGFAPVFVVAAALGVGGLGLLARRVRDPRHERDRV